MAGVLNDCSEGFTSLLCEAVDAVCSGSWRRHRHAAVRAHQCPGRGRDSLRRPHPLCLLWGWRSRPLWPGRTCGHGPGSRLGHSREAGRIQGLRRRPHPAYLRNWIRPQAMGLLTMPMPEALWQCICCTGRDQHSYHLRMTFTWHAEKHQVRRVNHRWGAPRDGRRFMTGFSGDEREEEGLALRRSLSCRSRTPDAAGDVFGLHVLHEPRSQI